MKTKCWFILREDLKYSSERLFKIGIKNIVQPFYTEFNKNVKEEWVQDGANFRNFMVFNMDFMYRIEAFLIENGHIFKWIYENKTVVGILIEPTIYNFRDDILGDCMTLEEYAKHRLEEFRELSKELDI